MQDYPTSSVHRAGTGSYRPGTCRWPSSSTSESNTATSRTCANAAPAPSTSEAARDWASQSQAARAALCWTPTRWWVFDRRTSPASHLHALCRWPAPLPAKSATASPHQRVRVLSWIAGASDGRSDVLEGNHRALGRIRPVRPRLLPADRRLVQRHRARVLPHHRLPDRPDDPPGPHHVRDGRDPLPLHRPGGATATASRPRSRSPRSASARCTGPARRETR